MTDDGCWWCTICGESGGSKLSLYIAWKIADATGMLPPPPPIGHECRPTATHLQGISP